MNDKKSIDKKHVVSTKLYSNHEEGFILQCNDGFWFEKSGFSMYVFDYRLVMFN